MKHYSDESWADFVRGVVATDRRAEMAAHLEIEGCGTCQSAVDWISQIQQVASRDRSFEVPLDVVKAARSIFPQAVAKNDWIGALQTVAAELVFETGLDWQPAGVRSVQAAETALTGGGRMVFEAGDYRVHVRIESPTTNGGGEIVGEITNRLEPADNLEGVVVQAITSGRTFSETTANRFGEFLIDYPFVEDTMLRLALKEKGVRIELVLDRQRVDHQKPGKFESRH